MADVFLSYASRDGDRAQAVAESLGAAGFEVWWDRHLLSGERFERTIQRELAGAAVVVVLWTPASVDSDWVYSEARRGHGRGALVQVRDPLLTIDDLPAPFDALHCPALDDAEALLRAVGAVVRPGPATAPARPPVPPAAAPAPASGPERKIVTALVVELEPAPGLDPEDFETALAPYRAAVLDAVERYGGTAEPGTGTSVAALFGASQAHEDDPERAVRTALALLTDLGPLASGGVAAFLPRAGIDTAPTLVSHRSAVSGQVTSSARRLQSSAPPGAILVGQETYRATSAGIDYEQTDDGWRPVGSNGSIGRQSMDAYGPMIGREDELALLQRSFTRCARESSVQLVTVVAEPGLGKSRLVQAFADWSGSREETVTWLQGACPPYGDAVAHAALAEIVKTHTGIRDADPDEQTQRRLEDAVEGLVVGTPLADQHAWLVSRLAPLVGLPAPAAAAEELYLAWSRYLEALTETGPLVLVFEDLHWADQASLDFLTQALEWTVGVPLLVVATARPEFHDKAPTWASGQRNATTLTLAPLSERETDQLLTSLQDEVQLPDRLLDVVRSRTGGNPLYAREYVAMLAESAAAGADETSVLNAVTLPGSLHALIAARLDTLPDEFKRLLQAASVLGHTFWPGAVGSLTAVPRESVEARLRELVRREFVRRARGSSVAGETEYDISHALIADVAYGQLARADRARYHEAAGLWLAAPVADNAPGGESALVAHHFAEALRCTAAAGADHDRLAGLAAVWHTRAAEFAQPHDVDVALGHVEAALSLTPVDDPERAGRLLLLGAVQSRAGRAEAAHDTYQQAQLSAESAGQPALAGLAQTRRAGELHNLFRNGEAVSLAAAAVAALERLPPGPELVEAYLHLASGLDGEGGSPEAIEAVENALTLIEVLPQTPLGLQVWARLQRAQYALWRGEPRAEADLTSALSIAEEAQLTHQMSTLHDDLATLCGFARSVEESLPHCEAAVSVAEHSGLWGGYLVTIANLVEGLVLAGHLERALTWCERASTRVPLVGRSEPTVIFNLYWAWALLLSGNRDRALELATAAYQPALRGTANLIASGLLVGAESHAAGTALRREAVDGLAAATSDPKVARSLMQYLPRTARLLAETGDPGHLELLGSLIAATPTELPFYRHNVLSARAVLLESRGDVAGARDLHTRAAAAWAGHDCPLEEAHALVGVARCRIALGESADDIVLRARTMLHDMGADGLLPLVEQLSV